MTQIDSIATKSLSNNESYYIKSFSIFQIAIKVGRYIDIKTNFNI